MNTRTVTQSGTLQYRRLPVDSVVESGQWPNGTLPDRRVSLGATLLLAAMLMTGCSSSSQWTRRAYSFSLAADPATTNASGEIVALSRVAISSLFQSRSFTYR